MNKRSLFAGLLVMVSASVMLVSLAGCNPEAAKDEGKAAYKGPGPGNPRVPVSAGAPGAGGADAPPPGPAGAAGVPTTRQAPPAMSGPKLEAQ